MNWPRTDQRREEEKKRRPVLVSRPFAIATKKTTRQQFLRFLDETRAEHSHEEFTPGPDEPENSVTWYEAVKYCRWLSEKEGIDETKMCYPRRDQIKPGMVLSSNYLSLTGYRLPTEAEWEYACRAGSTTRRFYGHDDGLLGDYAWYDLNTAGRTEEVAMKKPNDWGLFDAYGNVWDWCQDWYADDPSPDQLDRDIDFSGDGLRVLRGGSFKSGPRMLWSGERNYYRPDGKPNSAAGFRVARTTVETGSER
jgi:formylglycine-generating enzyme required for sulfatase activity